MTAFQPRRILVTGGAGFIGSNHIHFLLEAYSDVHVVNLDLLTYASDSANLHGLPDPDRYRFVHGDICNGDLVDEVLRKHRIDAIVHYAAESHVDRSIDGPATFVQTNMVGTFTLLDRARRYWLEECRLTNHQCRFHHVSTDEVYGSLGPDDRPFSENTLYTPNSPYAASKAGADHLVRSYLHTYGLPVVTTNCSNNYGPRQNVEKFIPTILRACLSGNRIPVYGDGSNVRDWLFVEDHCRAVDRVLREGRLGETYNIGGNCEMANMDIARTLCSIMDELHPEGQPHADLIEFVTDRPGHDWRYAINFSKLEAELGWQPLQTFESGIIRTAKWYLSNPHWRAKVEDGTYAETRLGLAVKGKVS